jgi:hypothetical protein
VLDQVTDESVAHDVAVRPVTAPSGDSGRGRFQRLSLLALGAVVLVTLVFAIQWIAVTKTGDPVLDTRAHDDLKAREEFSQLFFFARGDGMHISPGLVRVVPRKLPVLPDVFGGWFDRLYRRRWGITYEEGRPVGLFTARYQGMSVGAFGCVACHSGRAAGRFIVGLGNKNIDSQQVGRDLLMLERFWRDLWPDSLKSAERKRVEASAIRFSEVLADPLRGNLTQGLVPVSVIRDWFYVRGGSLHAADVPRGAVKVPALWGYGMKRSVGQFCDGFGDAEKPGWAVAVELVAGQDPGVVRAYGAKIQKAEMMFSDFLPPKYPFPIDPERAKAGKEIFEGKGSCFWCHGTYSSDKHGHPIYEAPNFVSWTNPKVQTDRDRLDGNTPDFRKLVMSSPLSDLVVARADRGDGYFAPRLVGIWARFPYLHNGSVPSIAALLTSPERRPTLFSLRDAGEESRFDPETLGLTVPPPGSADEADLLHAARQGERDVYYTKRCGRPLAEHSSSDTSDHSAGCGYSNKGHLAGITLPDSDKRNLIEYLKTL